jgi:hypothetical protein
VSQNLILNFKFLDLKTFKKNILGPQNISIEKKINYKVVDRDTDYNFDIKFIFIWVYMKKLIIFLYRVFKFILFWSRWDLKTSLDRDDTTE